MNDMITLMREEERRKEQLEILDAEKACDRPLPKCPQTIMPTEMTPEQRRVLQRLESGFEGTVSKLLSEDWQGTESDLLTRGNN
jgi:hypothetical protein